MAYDPSAIESKWQQFWQEHETFRAEIDPSKPKYYVLDMFPYPSGDGLHVGHPEGYTATDIMARYKRMRGFNVLHPMGWDAFGLPAEQYAIKTGTHPRITTANNIANFKRQIQSLGFSYDWSREIDTTDPNYVKWTQWIFLQLYHSYFDEESGKARPVSELEKQGMSRDEIDERRLAYVAETPVNWSPDLGTVLANEEVEEWRAKGHTVERRPLRQWMLRITAYAQRLIDELEDLDWPEGIKLLQRNWIGRSEGAEVTFTIDGNPVTVFTTRPDTLFGATYMVLAPEHPLVEEITRKKQKKKVDAYREECGTKSDLERTELAKEKSGVFTGAYAINPVNKEKIPVWIADYVMMGYGTGAIMAVPAHDERDYAFAEKFDIPIIEVVAAPEGSEEKCFTGEGTAMNSDFLDGLPTTEAKQNITAWLEEKGLGKKTINYKLRDWLFSRQRYWGEPFPIVWKDGRHEGIPEEELPLLAPELDDYKPTGNPEPTLAKASEWVNLGGGVTRETNTMPQWAGSCWYYLRYCDARNDERFLGEDAEDYWMARNGNSGGVDLYVGGTEHAVLHLLYARFWHKVLFDLGHLSTPEPFQKLVNQGLILGESDYFLFKNAESGDPVSSRDVRDISESGARLSGSLEDGTKVIGYPLPGGENDVEKRDGVFYWRDQPDIAVEDKAFKMSKSRGNVVNPDDVVAEYGADALRLYEMFMGPLEQVKPWSMKGVEGVYRFLGKVWRLVMETDKEGEWVLRDHLVETEPDKTVNKVVHATIKKVSEDIESLSFNTAISQMMVCTNELGKLDELPVPAVDQLLHVLCPFAPHLAEELHFRLAEEFDSIPSEDLALRDWPVWDEGALVEDEIEIVIQVNGKVRDKIAVSHEAGKDEIEEAALASEKVQGFTEGKTVRKVIVVPGRLVNVVAN